MFERAQLIFLHAETPLHAGAGGGVDMIDLPIQREVHNNLPTMHGAGIKGVFKDSARSEDGTLTPEGEALFGRDVTSGSTDHNSAVSFTDARLLAFPVKSLSGLFAWVTCPYILDRLQRDVSLANASMDVNYSLPHLDYDQCLLPTDAASPGTYANNLVVGNADSAKIVLEDAVFHCVGVNHWVTALSAAVFSGNDNHRYFRDKFSRSFVVISDDAFVDFAKHSTQIATRIKINPETGTVDGTGLWVEECLPSDTILYTIACVSRPSSPRIVDKDRNAMWTLEMLNKMVLSNRSHLQFGGEETTGRGLVRIATGMSEQYTGESR